MAAAIAPGVSTGELDAIGRDVLSAHGARSAPQLAYDFPGTTCISVNDEIAHDDGWTLRTPDGSLGAQFEHTLVITDGAPLVLTA